MFNLRDHYNPHLMMSVVTILIPLTQISYSEPVLDCNNCNCNCDVVCVIVTVKPSMLGGIAGSALVLATICTLRGSDRDQGHLQNSDAAAVLAADNAIEM